VSVRIDAPPKQKEIDMTKVAVIVFADTETHADLARVVNALITVQECKEGGDDVRLLFDGAGTKWVAELANPGHRSHRLYDSVKDRITGACSFCATAFGVKAAVQAAGVPLLDEYAHHPSVRSLISDGFHVLIF